MSDALTTPRLTLRRWQPHDEGAMAAVNRDAEVTRLLNRPVDDVAVEAFYGLMVAHWDQHGFGPWVVECREIGPQQGVFLGFAGLAMIPPYLAAAGTGPELGWRLARSAWGRGLATEAARAARDDAFGRVGLAHVLSIIHPENLRSQRVATKLGMQLIKRADNPAIGRQVQVWQQSPSTPLTSEQTTRSR